MRVFLISLAFLSVVLFFGLAPSKGVRMTQAVSEIPSPRETPASQDPEGTVNGALTPNLIPDDVAYSMFFGFVADREAPDERSSLASYMHYHGLDEIDIDKLIDVGNDFVRASRVIDQDRAFLPPAALNHRKRVLVNEMVSSLPNRISKPAAERVRRHVIEYMKQKIKIVPGPSMPASTHNMN